MTDPLHNSLPMKSVRVNGASQDDHATDKPIDTDQLLKRCMGNIDFAQSLLAELESTGSERIEEIRRLVAKSDCNAAADAAHSLKGTAAILAAEPLRKLAAEIEDLGRAGFESQLNELTDSLAKEMKRCLAFIPSIQGNSTES